MEGVESQDTARFDANTLGKEKAHQVPHSSSSAHDRDGNSRVKLSARIYVLNGLDRLREELLPRYYNNH